MKHLRKKASALLLAASMITGCAAQNIEESSAETETDGENIAFPESNETDFLDEADPPISVGFEQVPTLEQPEFVDNLWLAEEEEVYYQSSAVIAKGRASDLAEYRVFGDHYDYYITAFNFTLDEVFYGEEVSVGDTVSVGNFNSSYEYDTSLPTLKENGEYILFLHSTAENEQVGGLVDYNIPSPLFNCIPVVGDFCETKELFSDYGESENKLKVIKGKSLAYKALKNGEEAELTEAFADENYLAFANEEAKYMPNNGVFEAKMGTTFVVRLAEFEETLRDRVKKFKEGSSAEIDIFADNPNPAYTDVEFREEDGGAGEPQSYEDLQDFLNPEKMNFLAFRILDVYSPEEAYEITGDDIFTYDLTTLYRAVLTYDYLKNEPVEIEVNIAKAGTPQKQFEGFPPYEIGGEYAAYFTNMDLEAPRLVACPELLFTLKSDGTREYALHPMFTTIDFITAEGVSLDLGIEGGEISVITSTSNNPVKYVHKYDIEELAEFFRKDWTKRGYTFAKTEKPEKTEKTADPVEFRVEADRVYSRDHMLSDEEIAERYPDLSAKLPPIGAENPEQTISAEGLAYIKEQRMEMDRVFFENGSEEDQKYAEENGMYDFMLEDRQFFAADGGLFAVYGYRMLGELCASYYDIFFLSASEETLLYSGEHTQIDTDFLGNGEMLMMISGNGRYGIFSIFDRNGQSWTFNPSYCEIIAPDTIVRVRSE